MSLPGLNYPLTTEVADSRIQVRMQVPSILHIVEAIHRIDIHLYFLHLNKGDLNIAKINMAQNLGKIRPF